MKNNERIYVSSFSAETFEDNFNNGEQPMRSSSWDSDSMSFKNDPAGYASVEDALKAVCKANSFTYSKGSWESYGKDMGEDFGRFDGMFEVDVNNSEATPIEIAEWKAGKRKLYACYIVVELEVRSIRELSESEAESFEKKPNKRIIKVMNKMGYADIVVNKTITRAAIDKTMQVLMDNGIDEDDVEDVMHEIGQTLLDKELFEVEVVKK